MTTKTVFTMVFFLVKKLFLRNENLNRFCTKPLLYILFKFNTGFFLCCSLTGLVNTGKFASVLVCFIISTCLYFNLCWLTQPTTLPKIAEWNTKKRYRDTRGTSMFLDVLMSMSSFQCLLQITHLVLELILSR